jgi:hypothetical protein
LDGGCSVWRQDGPSHMWNCKRAAPHDFSVIRPEVTVKRMKPVKMEK